MRKRDIVAGSSEIQRIIKEGYFENTYSKKLENQEIQWVHF
jgi:hypothetical protein